MHELCSEDIDEDCDGDAQLGAVDLLRWFSDLDGDGFGDEMYFVDSCTAPLRHVDNDEDCDVWVITPTGKATSNIIDKCSKLKPTKTKGNKKCKLKNLFNVGLSTANPPHKKLTINLPKTGIAENRLVITVAPQKLI